MSDGRLLARELFRSHPLLGALTEPETAELLKHTAVRRVGAHQVLFQKGDEGDGLYGVLSGLVLIIAESTDGKELILNGHGPGEIFGEIALLDGEGRSATAVARVASEVLFLERGEFLAFLTQRPETMIRVIALLCQRLRRSTGMVEDAAFLGASTRLAKQLLALIDADGPRPDPRREIMLRTSQLDLARRLGVSREFVNKQLMKWRKAGVVELGRRRLTVRDPEALRQISLGSEMALAT